MQGVGPEQMHEPPEYAHAPTFLHSTATQRSPLGQSVSLEHGVRMHAFASNSSESHPSALQVSARLHVDGGGAAQFEKSPGRVPAVPPVCASCSLTPPAPTPPAPTPPTPPAPVPPVPASGDSLR